MRPVVSEPPVAVIFLDPDWVLINRFYHEERLKNVQEKEARLQNEYPWHPPHLTRQKALVQCFSPSALANLDRLIQKVSRVATVRIVIVSGNLAGASLSDLQEYVFADTFFRSLIVDRTADPEWIYQMDKLHGRLDSKCLTPSDISRAEYKFSLDSKKGREIDFWIRKNQHLFHSFVILGNLDEEISARYPGYFIQTNWKNLLSRQDADRAAEILQKPSLPMNFPSEERVRQALLQTQNQPNGNEAPMGCSIS